MFIFPPLILIPCGHLDSIVLTASLSINATARLKLFAEINCPYCCISWLHVCLCKELVLHTYKNSVLTFMLLKIQMMFFPLWNNVKDIIIYTWVYKTILLEPVIFSVNWLILFTKPILGTFPKSDVSQLWSQILILISKTIVPTNTEKLSTCG